MVEIALRIVDEEGPAGLTLSAVAGRAGVATPSLYKHVGSLAELRERVTLRVAEELTARLADAVLGRSGDDALRSLMHAYRRYVVDHPGRYRAMSQSPPAAPDVKAVSDRLLAVILAVLRGYGFSGTTAIHAARALRSAAHGFAALEAADGFGLPEDLNVSYELLIQILITGLTDSEARGLS